MRYCDWNRLNDIIKSFRIVDIVSCEGVLFNWVIFNVGGNKYRFICGYKFGIRNVVLYVRFVGMYKDYDKIKDVCIVNMFV